MGQLGISVYPSKSSMADMKGYIDLARKYGYTRLFTSMLEVADNAQETVETFKEIIHYGNENGLKTSLDVNPRLFKALDIAYNQLEVFNEMGIDALRLDEGFTGYEEAMLTHNPFGIKIELNISRGQHYIEMVNDFGPNRQLLIGSHNFYPQAYTGLSFDYFVETAKQYKNYNLETAAFIDSPDGKIGPWPLSDRMVSAEIQRDMSLAAQVSLLKMTGYIDDILISSSLLTEEDLKTVAESFKASLPILPVQLVEELTDLEKEILLNNQHLYRGDKSDYMIRSSQPRVTYKAHAIAPKNTVDIKRGMVTIGNDLAGQYKGELQIALQDRPNNGRQNVVASLPQENLALLDLLQVWYSFNFKET
ncbi:DUF871 domain-containing protein [Streptococcus parauberis]|uniref:Outer surface protein n=1 Tax=Streptococcus parauberis NCFD 2020 TaxID=873447 RepID=F1YXE7_9STRE|nr:MupG family TIM beta-alpha barrel fold protein [Streptococcus parauberis]EGE53862.1 hypothetical protein SPB_0072 [Streptococcus parauberis NCFD 2020]